jgi:DNA-binding NarL/FixJ family response regulator
LAKELAPNVILMDISMPDLNGIDAARQIKAQGYPGRIIALSVHGDASYVEEMLDAGASGYMLKNSAAVELLLAIKAVQQGNVYLSPKVADVVVKGFIRKDSPAARGVYIHLTAKQREVLQLLAEGKTNKEAAQRLHVAVKTIETHRAQIMEKLNIRTMAGLTKYAIREGLTSIDA